MSTNCLNCGAPVQQTPKKREKKFCKASCRVLFCQKKKKLAAETNKKPEVRPVKKSAVQAKKQPKKPAAATPIKQTETVKKAKTEHDMLFLEKRRAGKGIK